jgi:hypothetical protein
MTCDHQWQESGTSKKHDWVCSKCKILYTVLKGMDDDDIQTYIRPWQGLTDAEIVDIMDAELSTQRTEHFALCQAIEAKLRQKNT